MKKISIFLVTLVFLTSCAAAKPAVRAEDGPEATPLPHICENTQLACNVAVAIVNVCNNTMADLQMTPPEALEICVERFNNSFDTQYSDWPWPREDQVYNLALAITRDWCISSVDISVYTGEDLLGVGYDIGPINGSIAGYVRRSLEEKIIEFRVEGE